METNTGKETKGTTGEIQNGDAPIGTPPKGLYPKLSWVMANVAPVHKNGVNLHYNYKFVSQDQVYAQLRHLLGVAGVNFFVSMDELTDLTYTTSKGIEKPLRRVTFKVSLVDAETGQREDLRWFAEGSDEVDKAVPKAAAQAVKQFLMRTFLMSAPDEDDPDSGESDRRAERQNATGRIQQNRPPARPGNAGQGNAGQGNAGQGNAGQGNAGQGNAGSGQPDKQVIMMAKATKVTVPGPRQYDQFYKVIVPSLAPHGVTPEIGKDAMAKAQNDASAATRYLVNQINKTEDGMFTEGG